MVLSDKEEVDDHTVNIVQTLVALMSAQRVVAHTPTRSHERLRSSELLSDPP